MTDNSPEYFEQFVERFRLIDVELWRAFRAAATQARENAELREECKAFRAENKLLTHKIITCGVAADHSNANLAHTGAYIEKWDSPQAQSVRKLRQRAESAESANRALQAEVDRKNEGLEDALASLIEICEDVSYKGMRRKMAEQEILEAIAYTGTEPQEPTEAQRKSYDPLQDEPR